MSTQDRPPAERLDYWREMLSRSLGRVQVWAERPADFAASVRTVCLGAVDLSVYELSSLRVARTRKMIRSSDAEIYKVNMALHGSGFIEQNRNTCVPGPGHLSFLDTSSPHDIGYAEGPQGQGGMAVAVRIPHALLPIPVDQARRLYATSLDPERDSLGAVLANHLTSLARHADRLAPADAVRLGAVTLDLVAAVLARRLDLEATLPYESRQQAIYRQMLSFVESQLADPELSPAVIATAHHVSLRSLHRLFEADGRTVAGWIRHRRLDRCRRDLADPELAGQPIRAIAARWGFPRGGHFTRLFTSVVGMSPLAYRRLHQHMRPAVPARQRAEGGGPGRREP
ncbi:helix-turn-helix domain-containing protein [Plantactinospora sp. WMMC1484]|uniref:AraC-like ligand-binding domain-containing protein n=1 Tax=Plantactinospora sp. WMMC1484 TaxID=3404122 RepID=UPI003BF5EB8B